MKKTILLFIIISFIITFVIPNLSYSGTIVEDVGIAVGTRKGKEGYGPDRRKADVTIKWQNNTGKTVKATKFIIRIKKYYGLRSVDSYCKFELKSNKIVRDKQSVSQRWNDLWCDVYDWSHLGYIMDNIEITY